MSIEEIVATLEEIVIKVELLGQRLDALEASKE